MKTRILIVEDDRDIATVVAKNLETVGYTCDCVHNGNEVMGAFERLEPALILLDITLPGMDGLEITRQIRRQSAVPILMLTARSTMADKVLGLEIGADDYVIKPFGMQELLARVRALLRRSGQTGETEPLVRGDLVIDPQRRVVEKTSERMDITSLEFDLLYFMASHPGRVYSRDALMSQVWGEDRVVDARSIDSLISRLRRKLEADPAQPVYIQTVWGAGYRFAETGS